MRGADLTSGTTDGKDEARQHAGERRRQDDRPAGFASVSPRAPSDPFRHPWGTACRPSVVATTTTGMVNTARVSDAQRIPPVPKVGDGNSSAKNPRSIDSTETVDEEREAEHTEYDRWHAGEIVDGSAHQSQQLAPASAYSSR